MKMCVYLSSFGIVSFRGSLLTFLQGLEGPVTFTGSTPDLDDFTIRVVDGNNLLCWLGNVVDGLMFRS